MSNLEFRKGDYVVYGTNGVCKIEDITLRSLSSALPPRQYYILSQVRNSSTIYVPCTFEIQSSKMRYPMTVEDITSILLSSKDKTITWDNDRKSRTNLFREIISKGLSEDLILMIRCIIFQKEELQKNKKKLSNTDSDLLFTAQSIVEDEFSFVLGIPIDKIQEYIKSTLGITEEANSI